MSVQGLRYRVRVPTSLEGSGFSVWDSVQSARYLILGSLY